jgi:3-oxoacyl-[acyl-carrier-protein] synthase-1
LNNYAYIGPDNIISPLGFGTDLNFSGILSGRTALATVHPGYSKDPFCASLFDESIIDDIFEPLGNPLKFTRLEKISILAISSVLKRSGLNLSDPRTLLIYATTKGNINLLEPDASSEIAENRVYLPVFSKLLGEYFGCAKEPVVVSNACISGLLALVIAQRMIRAGLYDHIVVAGGDIVSEFTVAGFRSFNALSDEPCRPYDLARKGINLGEASAAVLLTRDKSRAGENPVIMTAGASANDANHISGPSRTGEGLLQALEDVMKETGILNPGFISAHGTATEFNDEMESIAFTRAGLSAVPVHSLKGYYGHTLGAAGLIESILGIHSLKTGKLIASAGYKDKGVSGDIQVIRQTDQKLLNSFIKTASGFGGCNAAAVFEREEKLL